MDGTNVWQEYIQARKVDEVLRTLSERGASARVVAGATDLILELERGVRRGVDTLVDVTRVVGLDQIEGDPSGFIHLGPLVTHNDCAASPLIRQQGYPLAHSQFGCLR